MQTTEKNTAKSNGRTNLKKANKPKFNSPKITLQWQNEESESHSVNKTPFSIVYTDNKWFTTLGKYRISEPFTTGIEALEDAQRVDWQRMMQVMQLMIEENAK